MNIFILNTGRCGSTTFIKACQHITNYSAAHESRATLIGEQRLAYPDNHIEADNRLSWILGRLDKTYGDDAFYVHLSRNRTKTAESFARRNDFGIIRAYREGILMQEQQADSALELAQDYIDTVESNIALFLKDKTQTMEFSLENAEQDFKKFWQTINAEGDLEAALAEWQTAYNAS
ncbi:MAG: hypothetical protein OQK69_07555 [Gammaproteobacteria bacterium]|nr:hypothetical protein [Gammaproteobacteria bacterium]